MNMLHQQMLGLYEHEMPLAIRKDRQKLVFEVQDSYKGIYDGEPSAYYKTVLHILAD